MTSHMFIQPVDSNMMPTSATFSTVSGLPNRWSDNKTKCTNPHFSLSGQKCGLELLTGIYQQEVGSDAISVGLVINTTQLIL